MARMNLTQVTEAMQEKTGIAAEQCGQIVKAFEKASEKALADKFRGVQTDRAQIIEAIAEATGLANEVCGQAVQAMEETMDEGLTKKLCFWKR